MSLDKLDAIVSGAFPRRPERPADSFTATEYMARYGVPDCTARRQIRALVADGIVVDCGKAFIDRKWQTAYILAESQEQAKKPSRKRK
jgi:hypothetical protein